MKTFAAATLIALFGMSSASADIYGEYDSVDSAQGNQVDNMLSLPATSAGANGPQTEYIHPDDDHG